VSVVIFFAKLEIYYYYYYQWKKTLIKDNPIGRQPQQIFDSTSNDKLQQAIPAKPELDTAQP
jgi:hypothetical protein